MNHGVTPDRLGAALNRAVLELLAARAPEGYWVGELSSSALSTATAACALSLVQKGLQHDKFQAQISTGLEWLVRHRNPDGGWGDTTLSLSNLSTTVLAWAAFGVVPGADRNERYRAAVAGAEHWISTQAGSLDPAVLARAIIRRYGKDRTFSVPILTTCALAGRLGAGPQAWEAVIPLPFELAACPHQWFAALSLPVVSYALPALIAIGQARYHHLPPRNPFRRVLRSLSRHRTLQVLQSIQPVNGGFLEATPLTSFVTLSLAGSGQAGHPVCEKGVQFLLGSQRPDGSWPIDSNLATWLTTLSVHALAGTAPGTLPAGPIRCWLLAQQYRQRHPYTDAAAGGWAWTDLPGGVPDADDTAGALLALRQLGPADDQTRAAASAGVIWLLELQNRDGGIPTFCRGWGALPFDRSSPDLTAHAIRAWAAWLEELPPPLSRRVWRALQRALKFVARRQTAEGAWIPLWFGNQFSPTEENPTYGTTRVICALAEVSPLLEAGGFGELLSRGLQWLLQAQNSDGAWGGFPQGAASVEETALAVEALAGGLACKSRPGNPPRAHMVEALGKGTNWLMEKIESGQWQQPAPIGFYFAKLWYYERLYPLIFTVSALSRSAPLFPLSA